MDQLVRNERTKLTATYLNGLAIAVFVVGGIAPVFNAINHVDPLTLALALTVGICLSSRRHYICLQDAC